MIEVTAPLWLWTGGGGGNWYFVTVPEEQSGELRAEGLAARGFGSVKVEATINGVTWRTSVFPQKSGGYILPVKAQVRRAAGIAVGDEISVNLELLGIP